jgi:hypothetical protein
VCSKMVVEGGLQGRLLIFANASDHFIYPAIGMMCAWGRSITNGMNRRAAFWAAEASGGVTVLPDWVASEKACIVWFPASSITTFLAREAAEGTHGFQCCPLDDGEGRKR